MHWNFSPTSSNIELPPSAGPVLHHSPLKVCLFLSLCLYIWVSVRWKSIPPPISVDKFKTLLDHVASMKLFHKFNEKCVPPNPLKIPNAFILPMELKLFYFLFSQSDFFPLLPLAYCTQLIDCHNDKDNWQLHIKLDIYIQLHYSDVILIDS